MVHHKKNHGRCKTPAERCERKQYLYQHRGSVWKDNVLVNEKTGEPIPGVPSGREIRQKNEPDWKKGKNGKTRNRTKRKRKAYELRREAEDRRYRNVSSPDSISSRRRIFTPGSWGAY